jgi:hypothetical protein
VDSSILLAHFWHRALPTAAETVFLFPEAIAFVELKNFPFVLWLDALSMSE